MLSHWVGERKGAPAPLWGLDGVTVAHRQAKQGANKRYAKHTDCGGGHKLGATTPQRSVCVWDLQRTTNAITVSRKNTRRLEKKIETRFDPKKVCKTFQNEWDLRRKYESLPMRSVIKVVSCFLKLQQISE